MAPYTHLHSFHIPVMGIGFTIDTPVKVAPYGISSVISLVDDMLMEKMREFYCKKLEEPFQAISEKIDDFRSKRITAYLNLVDRLVKDKIQEIKQSVLERGSMLEKYLELLPDTSVLREKVNHFLQTDHFAEAQQWLQNNLNPGSIDINIMTKVDKDNFRGKEKLPVAYNDAHAAVRGFAESDLESSLVLSAGMNPRLYSYLENFPGFYPDAQGNLSKKITLKVSDYRSAAIQARFLAKKGIWVSEFRIESGLNCGGHAFATQGHLMGPILQEFKDNREKMVSDTWETLIMALKNKNLNIPDTVLPVTFSAQGGIGTHEEHEFLLEYYQIDSIGWATPFLLVPEVTNVDANTLDLLSKAGEKDLEVSNISPLGIPFNSLKNNTKDIEKQQHIDQGRPGSACTKRYAALHNDISERGLCTASREYQRIKIRELDNKGLSPEDHKKALDDITIKSCICVGLGTSALLCNDLDTKTEGEGVSVCPGPNIAYFSTISTLAEMVDHIYGKKELPIAANRPHFFIKELTMYIDFLKEKSAGTSTGSTTDSPQYLKEFKVNLLNGISYYRSLFSSGIPWFLDISPELIQQLDLLEEEVSVALE